MKASYHNKLDAYDSSLRVLREPESPLRRSAIANEKIAAVDGMIASIKTLASRQAEPVRGSLQNRDQILEDMQAAALQLGNLVLSFAASKKNSELAAQVRLRPSSFAGRKANSVQLAQRVHAAAASVAAEELAPYGVTPELLAQLQAHITAADAALSGPRTVAARKQGATKQLPALFKTLDATFEDEIDPLVRAHEKQHPEFCARYKAARIIIDRRGGHDTGPDTPPTPPPPAT